MKNDVRLIDANVLEKLLSERANALADEHGWHDHYTTGFDDARTYVEVAPTIDAVPFDTFAGVCKHANISCVDPDNRVYDRVCLYTRPMGHSWGTCSFEVCPFIVRNQEEGASE